MSAEERKWAAIMRLSRVAIRKNESPEAVAQARLALKQAKESLKNFWKREQRAARKGK